MAHKMGSAPSQYFQGDGAKPGAQSHNLSYNSTGWVASAVLVNTRFRSVCLLISRNPSPIRLHMTSLLSSFVLRSYLFILTDLLFLWIIFLSSQFLLHLWAGSTLDFQPRNHMKSSHLFPLVCISGLKRATVSWCNLILCWFIVFHWSGFFCVYCSVLGVIINWFQPFRSTWNETA